LCQRPVFAQRLVARRGRARPDHRDRPRRPPMIRFLHRSTQIAVDFAVLSLALWAAFFLRFEGVPPSLHLERLVFVWPYVVGFQYAVLAGFGVPRYAW